MKWVEKNWVVILIVVLAYLYFNGSLGNIFGSTATTSAVGNGGGTAILGG